MTCTVELVEVNIPGYDGFTRVNLSTQGLSHHLDIWRIEPVFSLPDIVQYDIDQWSLPLFATRVYAEAGNEAAVDELLRTGRELSGS